MPKLSSFTMLTLNGYYAGPKEDLSWAQVRDPEFQAFSEENAKSGGALLFGRKTYDMMVRYWPTPQAAKENPVVAERMNALPKVVFSRTLDEAEWQNTKVVKGDLASEVRKLKKAPGPDMVIMGSGSIVAQLAQQKLIDALQVVIFPVVLGDGKKLFAGVPDPLRLKLASSRTFANGIEVLSYHPA
jgi:dihydrofolate reductase